MTKTQRLILTSILLTVFLASCQPQPAPAGPNLALTQAFQTAVAQISQPTQTPAPSNTPIPTATIPLTPPVLPAAYVSPLLDALDTPRTYISDTCQYLKSKWDPNNAAPGTIVMTIMFHSITKGRAESSNQITSDDFKKLMNDLHDMGFQAINMTQMVDFMYNNAKIPQRSVLLIVDDRHFAEYFNDHFRPFYEQWGWPVVNAYIAKDERPDLWAENAALSNEGWVDYQAHGFIHNINITNASTDDFINGEMGGAITSFQKYLNKTPIAYIWPGGSFSARAVQIGRQLGYKLGFTVNPRGPVMFNWVPQADNDPAPYALSEGPVNDPLMTLPRYWDTDARSHLDTVRQIGTDAAAYAEQNKAAELEYYDIVCAPALGALPAANP